MFINALKYARQTRQSQLCVSWTPRAINFHANARPWQRQRNPTLSPIGINFLTYANDSLELSRLLRCACNVSVGARKENPRCTLLNKKCCIRSGTKREKLKFTMKRKSCSYTRTVRMYAQRNGKLNMRSLQISAAYWCLSQSTEQWKSSNNLLGTNTPPPSFCYHMEAQC